MFELCGDDILLRLGSKSTCLALQAVAATACLVEVLRQLLCDSTTATLATLAQNHGLDTCTRRSLEVDTRVVEEADILRSEQRSNDGGQLMTIYLEPLCAIFGE